MRVLSVVIAVTLGGSAAAQSDSGGAAGYVEPAKSWEITPVLDGQIRSLHFREGDVVAQGDLLVEMSDTFLKLELDRDRSVLEMKRAEFRDLSEGLERMGELRKRDAVSEANFLQAQFAVEAARISVETAEIDVRMAEAKLGASTIKAPAAGMISGPRWNERAYFNRGSNLSIATIVQLDPINVRVTVALDWVLRELKNKRFTAEELRDVPVNLALPDDTRYPHSGRIVGIGDDLDPETGDGSLIFEFPNPDGILRPGLQVIVRRAPD